MKWFNLSMAGLMLATTNASAAEETETFSLQELNVNELIEKGGIMMYPLALLSLAAVVLILLYLLTIRRNAVVSDRFMNAADAMIRKRDFLGLISYSHRQNSCIARITQKSLEFMTKNSSTRMSEIREIAESEGSRQAGLLSSRITYLADIGSIAPMVGLLGTVVGMIKSFLVVSQGGGAGVKQMELASGVSEALVTTATGLAIGIPALVFYSIFRGKVQKYVSELEAATTHLMAMLHAQIERQRPQHQGGHPEEAPYMADQRPDLHGI